MDPERPGDSTPALQPPQEGLPLTEQPCRNCGDPTPGNYCRTCGQRKAEHRASVRRLLADALQDQFSLTSELPRTFKALILRPGFLTAEYNRGRIAAYIPPFRVYLFTSIIFFLLLSLQASGRSPFGESSNFNVRVNTDTTGTDSTGNAGTQAAPAAETDTVGASDERTPVPGRDRNLTPFDGVNAKLRAKSAQWSDNRKDFNDRIKEFMLRRSPTMVFLLLPVFALIMKLFYVRKDRYYAEHFIFALHTHAMAFLVFAVLVVVPDDGILDVAGTALFIWLMIYPLIAMRKVYNQGWIITFMKYSVIGVLYTVVFGLAMYVQFIIALLIV